MNIQVTLPDVINQRLIFARDKYKFDTNKLITDLLADYLQDLADGEEAIRIMAENNPRISLQDIIKENGLED